MIFKKSQILHSRVHFFPALMKFCITPLQIYIMNVLTYFPKYGTSGHLSTGVKFSVRYLIYWQVQQAMMSWNLTAKKTFTDSEYGVW